jgi:hypothetical protein
VAQDKYPYLSGCYVDDGFERKLTREFLQATVEVSHYKGARLLRVLPAPPKRGEKHRCSCPLIQYPTAWLHGDELDALIKILREAKRVWLAREFPQNGPGFLKIQRWEVILRQARQRPGGNMSTEPLTDTRLTNPHKPVYEAIRAKLNTETAHRAGRTVEPVGITVIERAERMAIGHSDYVSKYAHAATDLVFRKETT